MFTEEKKNPALGVERGANMGYKLRRGFIS